MHEVLFNRLGGLSLPRKSVVRLTDRPDMTLDVYRGRKTTMQHKGSPARYLLCLLIKRSRDRFRKIFSIVNVVLLQTAFHYYPHIVLILLYINTFEKVASHSSPVRVFKQQCDWLRLRLELHQTEHRLEKKKQQKIVNKSHVFANQLLVLENHTFSMFEI